MMFAFEICVCCEIIKDDRHPYLIYKLTSSQMHSNCGVSHFYDAKRSALSALGQD